MSGWGGERWNPAVTVLMILLGLPLLLPGVCSYIFTRGGLSNPIAGIGFLISFGGIGLILFGIRRIFSPPSQPPSGESVKLVLLIVLLVLIVVTALGLQALGQIKWRN